MTEALPDLNPPADFSLYHTRRDLIAKRAATSDPVKRGQINILLEQIQELELTSDPHRRADIAVAIEKQMKLMAL